MGANEIAKRLKNDSSTGKDLGEGDVDKKSDSPKGKANVDDFYRLALVLGEMQMYGHVLSNSLDEKNSKKAELTSETVSDITGNTVEFIGSFNITNIAEKNAISWKEDVISSISDGDVVRE